MSTGQYVATRSFPTTQRQYEMGDSIDTTRITSSELNAGIGSGAIVPARFADTAARLAALNPVVGPGVQVYATDTAVLKIGTDGVTPYSSLPIAGSGAFAPVAGPSGQFSVPQFGKKAAAIRAGTAQLKYAAFGDSFATKISAQILPIIQAACGGVAGYIFPGSFTTTGSGVTDNTASFDAWPTGITETIAAGGTRTYKIGGGNFTCTQIKVYYVKEPGAGTFKVQVNGVDASAPNDNISAAGTLGQLGIVTITQAATSTNITLVGLTGNVRIITPGFLHEGISGVVHASMGQGGIGLDTATAAAWANFQAWCADYTPDIVTYEMKEPPEIVALGLDAFVPAIQTGSPTSDIVLIQSPPQATTNENIVTGNATIRTKASQYGVVTWDSYAPFGTYAKLVALGWHGDGIHVTNDCDLYRGLLMMRDLGMLNVLRIIPLDVKAGTVDITTTLRMGSQGTPGSHLSTALGTSGDLSVTFTGGKNIIFTGSNGTQLQIPCAGGSNFKIASYTQIGTGPFLHDETSTQLSSRVNAGSLASFYASFFQIGTGAQTWKVGTGSPEGAATAPVASLFSRTDGGSGTVLYQKQTGTGNTGWARTLTAVATGTGTLVGGTVTISDAAITANSVIRLSCGARSGTPGAIFVSALTAGASFTVTSTSGTDTSSFQYDVISY